MCFIWASGRRRNRKNRTIKSAESSASRPGTLLAFGSIRPVFGSSENRDRAFEPVPPGEDARELRQYLLGAVLLVPRDEDDALALARPLAAGVDERLRSGLLPRQEGGGEQE